MFGKMNFENTAKPEEAKTFPIMKKAFFIIAALALSTGELQAADKAPSNGEQIKSEHVETPTEKRQRLLREIMGGFAVVDATSSTALGIASAGIAGGNSPESVGQKDKGGAGTDIGNTSNETTPPSLAEQAKLLSDAEKNYCNLTAMLFKKRIILSGIASQLVAEGNKTNSDYNLISDLRERKSALDTEIEDIERKRDNVRKNIPDSSSVIDPMNPELTRAIGEELMPK